MADFKRAVEFVLLHEGEWASDPRDPGKRTRWGISSRWNPDIDLDALTRERAVEVYRERYWAPLRGEQLPEALGLLLLDWSVLQGVGPAIKALQSTLGVEADGIIGPKTLAAVDAQAPRPLARRLLAVRKTALLQIGNRAFVLGWICRLLDLALEI
jgi:lysozyme family protein